jgi:hypothetical protein
VVRPFLLRQAQVVVQVWTLAVAVAAVCSVLRRPESKACPLAVLSGEVSLPWVAEEERGGPLFPLTKRPEAATQVSSKAAEVEVQTWMSRVREKHRKTQMATCPGQPSCLTRGSHRL